MGIKLTLYRKKEKLKRSIKRIGTGRCTVLLYHRIIDLKYDPQQLCVSSECFEAQLRFLKKSHTFLDIEEFSNILRTKTKFPRKSLLITFDDGYADNYYNALPVLESLSLPAIFYVSTKGINTNDLFWWDELDLIFKKQSEMHSSVDSLLKKHNQATVEMLYTFYLHKCKTAGSLSERDSLMEEVRGIVSLNEEDKKNHKLLTTEELKKLGKSKSVTIGAHTVNHLSLAHLNDADKKWEIETSLKALSVLFPKTNHFSFPYGEKTDYDEKTIQICKDLGFKSTAANYGGYVIPESDLFSFTRFVVRNDEPKVLWTKMREML